MFDIGCEQHGEYISVEQVSVQIKRETDLVSIETSNITYW